MQENVCFIPREAEHPSIYLYLLLPIPRRVYTYNSRLYLPPPLITQGVHICTYLLYLLLPSSSYCIFSPTPSGSCRLYLPALYVLVTPIPQVFHICTFSSCCILIPTSFICSSHRADVAYLFIPLLSVSPIWQLLHFCTYLFYL